VIGGSELYHSAGPPDAIVSLVLSPTLEARSG